MMADPMTKETFVTEQLVARGLKDTAANRKKLKTEYDTKYLGGSSSDWRTFFKQQFPQLAGMVDGGQGEQEARRVFGNQFIDLFLDVAKNPDNYDTTSSAGVQAFTAKVQATDYYNKTKEARVKWDLLKDPDKQERLRVRKMNLAAGLGDLQLTEAEINDLALYAEQNNASDLELKYVAYDKLGQRSQAAVQQTTEASKLKKMLANYGYQPVDIDARIQAALTGTSMDGVIQSQDSLIAKAKQFAKTKYSHLSDMIDKDFTIDDIFEPYRDIAAKVLERNPADIKIDDPMFSAALEAGPDGKSMSGTMWMQRLKQDPRYGWQFTKNANDQVRNTIMGLEKAFGLVR